jgi:hypothetical protein
MVPHIAVGLEPQNDSDAPPANLRVSFMDPNAPTGAGIPESPALGAHRFHAVVCSNCGHGDFLHQKIIEDWIRNNPLPGGLS